MRILDWRVMMIGREIDCLRHRSDQLVSVQFYEFDDMIRRKLPMPARRSKAFELALIGPTLHS